MINEVCPTIQCASYNDMYRLFSTNKIPYYATLIPYFIHKEYIVLKNNVYSWIKKEPIYYKEIEEILLVQIKKRQVQYENRNSTLNEDNAIAFLKSKGYKIMKPITEYEEV